MYVSRCFASGRATWAASNSGMRSMAAHEYFSMISPTTTPGRVRSSDEVFVPVAIVLGALSAYAALAVVIFLTPQNASPWRLLLIAMPVGLLLAALLAAYGAWVQQRPVSRSRSG